MELRPKLLVSERRLQEKVRDSEKNVLAFSSCKYILSVVWKLSTIGKGHQDQSCWFQRGDYRNEGHTP
jgi:hypothetical protein